MKINALFWIYLVTAVLVILTVSSQLGTSFKWIFTGTLIGQLLLLTMVYKILTDDYETDKTFEDFYEDRPDLGK
ncbi:hypothetical protein JCM19294_2027 [Nonlabens tegetincola]|uniref:Uncharacterized protein n=1 Tax=Nonlabens tegetincola TaxID=323273 RepID=A0A090Q0C9_9FLAO|nr:hypothetical protein [Nonlabens tegetincola]GAK96514.1 hypothetical protein JCM19294_2027 [Nonlabens tegetincola]